MGDSAGAAAVRKRRVVHGAAAKLESPVVAKAAAAELIAEQEEAPPPPLPVLVYREDLAQARQDILCWLAGGAQYACAVLVKSVELAALGKKLKRKRLSFPSTASADARYIIDTIMERAPAARLVGGAGAVADYTMDELAVKREELMRATRELRKEENA